MKKIVAISDVHIKKPADQGYELFFRFLTNPLVKNADGIFLLGDIFDLMCGPHEEYAQLYKNLFSELRELIKEGKKIYFFEGNHDLHLEKFFHEIANLPQIIVSQKPIIQDLGSKKYYFSHGDEHDVENKSYQKYIKIIRSSPLKFVAHNLMPYSVLTFLGDYASRMSRKSGRKKFNLEKTRDKFRKGVARNLKSQVDFVLGGHSHVQDQFYLEKENCLYLNNGFAQETQTFISIINHQVSFVPINSKK